jgi:putative Holliday junction resolvase
MRALGIDVGERRVGLAISDPSGTIARPLDTLAVAGLAQTVALVTRAIERLAAEEEGLVTIVVGMPSRLDGSPTNATPRVGAFVAALRARTAIPVVTEDERLSSREAESRLAVRERDWRRRKSKLDAAAAAVILQDYLDRRQQ